jgi:hypothetical protein
MGDGDHVGCGRACGQNLEYRTNARDNAKKVLLVATETAEEGSEGC